MIAVVCDEHDVEMDRSPSFCGWLCPRGDAAFGDEDYYHLLDRGSDARWPMPPQIRVTGCKERLDSPAMLLPGPTEE